MLRQRHRLAGGSGRQRRQMRLDADLQQSRHQGEAGGGADLAKQAVKPGGIGAQLRRQRRQPDGDQRREQQATADRLQCAAGDDPGRAVDRRNERQQPQAGGHQDPPARKQDAVVDLADHLPDNEHRRDHQDAARDDRQTGHRRIVAERPLGHRRQKDDGRKEEGAHNEVVGGGEREIHIPQNLEAQDPQTEPAGPHRHQAERDDHDCRFAEQLGRAEPVDAHGPFQPQLQRADADDQQQDPDKVDRLIRNRFCFRECDAPHPPDRKDPERQVDCEHPTP